MTRGLGAFRLMPGPPERGERRAGDQGQSPMANDVTDHDKVKKPLYKTLK